MAIPEAQLKTWSNQGAITSAIQAYEAVRRALQAEKSPLTQKKIEYEVYLQGSYKNSTNFYGNSDVDVVVQLNSSYQRDISSWGDDIFSGIFPAKRLFALYGISMRCSWHSRKRFW